MCRANRQLLLQLNARKMNFFLCHYCCFFVVFVRMCFSLFCYSASNQQKKHNHFQALWVPLSLSLLHTCRWSVRIYSCNAIYAIRTERQQHPEIFNMAFALLWRFSTPINSYVSGLLDDFIHNPHRFTFHTNT